MSVSISKHSSSLTAELQAELLPHRLDTSPAGITVCGRSRRDAGRVSDDGPVGVEGAQTPAACESSANKSSAGDLTTAYV